MFCFGLSTAFCQNGIGSTDASVATISRQNLNLEDCPQAEGFLPLWPLLTLPVLVAAGYYVYRSRKLRSKLFSHRFWSSDTTLMIKISSNRNDDGFERTNRLWNMPFKIACTEPESSLSINWSSGKPRTPRWMGVDPVFITSLRLLPMLLSRTGYSIAVWTAIEIKIIAGVYSIYLVVSVSFTLRKLFFPTSWRFVHINICRIP